MGFEIDNIFLIFYKIKIRENICWGSVGHYCYNIGTINIVILDETVFCVEFYTNISIISMTNKDKQ